jgi:hypothetical protein
MDCAMKRGHGIWTLRSLHKVCPVKLVATEVAIGSAKCNLDLVGVQKVIWEKSGAERVK